jgi:2-amino-4-hydroxy-6-hydroxymethyldihydropteridine diphosphokinase
VHVVTLGLGANLGDRLASLQRAVELLAGRGVRAVASSRVWETEPIGGPEGQPAYLNAVVRAETELDPAGVLTAANGVEAALGRSREIRWGPRTIDIDVLLYDDLRRDDPELTIPHPRLAERGFVVLPLLDIDPDPVLPDGTRLLDLRIEPDGAMPVGAPLALP